MALADPQLLTQVREIAIARVGAFLARGLDGLAPALEALQSASTSLVERKILGQAISQIRPCRAALESTFMRAMREVFDRKVSGAAPKPEAGVTLDQLTLVDDAAIELEIALGTLVRKTIEEIEPEQYYGIESRVGEVAAGRRIEGAANPLGVETALAALKRACEEVSDEGAVQMALANALQPHVAAGLRHAYREVNERLAEAGVQARLQYAVERAHDGGVARKERSEIPAGMSVSQALNLRDLLPISTGSPVDMATILQGMLSGPPEQQRASARILSNPKGTLFPAAVATPVDPALIQALHGRQAQSGEGEGGAGAALRALVAQQVQHPLDRLTGDLIANVFELMGTDHAVPDPVRREIDRLPIAAFKAAMLDRTFFAKAEHPLRRFLAEIDGLAADPETDTSPGSPFLGLLRETVDELVGTFDQDLSVFDAAAGRVRARTEANADEGRKALADDLARLEGAERRQTARARASATIAAQLDARIPAFVERFLSEVWSDAVADAEANHSTGENAADRRLALVQDLAWSVAPKSPDDLKRLRDLLPRLVPALQRGMADAGMPEPERKAFLDELMKTHTGLLQTARGAKPVPAPTSMPTRVAAVPVPVYSLPPSGLPKPLLDKGAIVEFRTETGSARAKLAWVSPQRTRYAFTSSASGARFLSREELSRALADGAARVIGAEPTAVERAIAVVTR